MQEKIGHKHESDLGSALSWQGAISSHLVWQKSKGLAVPGAEKLRLRNDPSTWHRQVQAAPH